jgi:hypothetical protein
VNYPKYSTILMQFSIKCSSKVPSPHRPPFFPGETPYQTTTTSQPYVPSSFTKGLFQLLAPPATHRACCRPALQPFICGPGASGRVRPGGQGPGVI